MKAIASSPPNCGRRSRRARSHARRRETSSRAARAVFGVDPVERQVIPRILVADESDGRLPRCLCLKLAVLAPVTPISTLRPPEEVVWEGDLRVIGSVVESLGCAEDGRVKVEGPYQRLC